MAKTNPYLDADLDRLADACQGRAGELLRPKPRTADERAALAEDTALLLMAVGRRIEPSWYSSAGPEQGMAEMRGLADRFGDWAEQLKRKARYEVLLRAANVVHGNAADGWIREARLAGVHAYALAVESDDGLRRVLAHLEELAVASGRKPGRQRG